MVLVPAASSPRRLTKFLRSATSLTMETPAKMDAMGRQKNISKTIIDKGADYVLALKEKQGTLHDNVELFFQDYLSSVTNQPAFDFYQSTDGDHGRVEIRKYWTTSDINWLQGKEAWQNLNTIGMVQRERLSAMTSVLKLHTTSAVSKMMPNASVMPFAATGALKIVCIGFWMSLFEKMKAAFVKTMLLKTSLFSGIWPLTF